MKKVLSLIMTLLLLYCACSCSLSSSKDTEWWEDTQNNNETQSAPAETAKPSPITHLYGEWKNEHGDEEPIDESTIHGSRYTVKSVVENEYGDITATLTVNGSDVVYTIYRYKVGYAEYSYMEAHFTAKDTIIIYTK